MAYLSFNTITASTTTPRTVRCSSSGGGGRRRMMLRWWALQVFLGVAIQPGHAILPEIVNNDIHHLLDQQTYRGGDEAAISDNHIVVQAATEHPTEDRREELEDPFSQLNQTHDRPPGLYNETASEKVVVGNQSDKILDNNIPAGDTEDYFTSSVVRANGKDCIIAEDCERGRYCLYDTHNSKCLPCKALDVPCTKDEECCDGHMCVWGQCSPNATKGEPGSICQYQGDCREDLCCALHKAKPIERERCLAPPNHLMGRLFVDMKREGPLEHCPCVGALQCQPLGRGSLCLQGEKSSEEDLADTLYSEIDYIV